MDSLLSGPYASFMVLVALVVFARWNPINCIYASLLFGAA